MLQPVNVGHKSLGDYGSIASRGLIDEIRRLAEPFRGKRVVHLSATAFGGGVAEINYTLVPLMADVGLEVEWRIIRGADEFFEVTKAIHNGLQGDPRSLTGEEIEIFRRYNALNAEELPADDYDFVIVHDPQPVGMIDHFPTRARSGSGAGTSTSRRRTRRCSTSSCLRSAATTQRSSICGSTSRTWVGCRRSYIWPPAIDPLTPKNMALSPEDAEYIVDQFGIDVERPLLTQVSRFDPWKDPLGVIDAYRQVKDRVPRSSSRSSARWRTTTPRAGTTTTARSSTPMAIRTSTSSRI